MRDAFLIVGGGFAAFVIGAFFFLYSQNAAPHAVVQQQSTGTTVPFTELAEGTQSKVLGRTNYLITSTTQLSNLWSMIDAQGQIPDVDFDTHVVMAVFAGKQSTAGYAIAVSKVEDSTVRQVTVTVTSPGGSCLLAQSVTAPYQIVEVSKTSLTFTHTDIATTASCLQ